MVKLLLQNSYKGLDMLSIEVRRRIRQIRNKHATSPMTRMAVRIANWKNNADSPVLLMIDDLTNAYVKKNGETVVETYGDWGGLFDSDRSFYTFLYKNLVDVFPEIKITFFMITGKINPFNMHQPFSFAERSDYNQKAIKFFRKIKND
jgi:hypothetical protein